MGIHIEINDDLLHSSVDPHDLADIKGMKILHCPFEVGGNMHRICFFLRKLGLNAVSVNYYDTWLKYNCDLNLKLNVLPPDQGKMIMETFARSAIEEFDIFHFHFNHSLLVDFSDLEILKDKGKVILFSFWGIDMRSPEWYYYHQARFLGYHPPKPYFLNVPLYQIHRKINQFADVMIGPFCIPRGLYVAGMPDYAEWSPETREVYKKKSGFMKDPNKTYILHSPTNLWKKGSHMILRLLDECRAEGLPIEVLYVTGKLQEEAKAIYANADYVIDMVGHGSFGLIGLEMMGWEIPVLVYQTELADRIRNYPPVIKITRENFKQQIEKCVEMKKNGEIHELGSRCRHWAVTHTEVRTQAIPQYVHFYAECVRGNPVPQLINRSWFIQEQMMRDGKKSDFYLFMKENKVFDEIGINTPDYDKSLYN